MNLKLRRSICAYLSSAALALVTCVVSPPTKAIAQAPPDSIPQAPYSLNLSVNEVTITFHAADAYRRPVLGLKPEEIDVFDNDHGPGQIVSLRELDQRPIRMGVLIDTSGSVATQIARSRAAAQEAGQKLLTLPTDRGSAFAFGRSRHVIQDWTSSRDRLVEGIGQIGARSSGSIAGTSVYDTLMSTCLYDFGKNAGTLDAANVILLFSDGADTDSHGTMQGAIDTCRQNHTAIYSFSPKPATGEPSLGPSVLQQITGQTGGRLFYLDDPQGDIHADIETVASDLRNGYFLIYRPRTLKHDGAFHRIVLIGSGRVAEISGTSGFYAPSR